MDVATPIIKFFAQTVRDLIEFLNSYQLLPGVSLWTFLVACLFIFVTISMFVRSGKV